MAPPVPPDRRPPGPPAVVETHISTLFFYRDVVLKLRRPVTYGFADFHDVERRRADCEREVELNRRLAPDVYLGTATISMDADTADALDSPAGGHPLDHAVVMRRLPEDRNLAALVRRHEPVDEELRAIARTLAAFHDRASRSPQIAAAGTATAIWQRWQATEDELARFIGPVVDRARYRELTRLARRYLDGRGPLFERRTAEGAVCDGHGDLHATDVFCMADGPRILDCLEFDDELRYGDVLADLAFLVEDLELLGAPQAATVFLDEYRHRSGRGYPQSLFHFYVGYRAHVRLLVECLRQEQGLAVGVAPDAVLEQALGHLRAAQVRLVLVGGLPGSGKSTLSAWIGARFDAEVLSTDLARRRERPPSEPPEQRYSEPARTDVYRNLLARAASLLRTGRSVIVDATWGSAEMRGQAASVARATSAELVSMRCQCPPGQRDARITARLDTGEDASEATPSVAALLGSAEDPWPTARVVDTSATVEETRRQAVASLGATRCADATGEGTGRRPGGGRPARPQAARRR